MKTETNPIIDFEHRGAGVAAAVDKATGPEGSGFATAMNSAVGDYLEYEANPYPFLRDRRLEARTTLVELLARGLTSDADRTQAVDAFLRIIEAAPRSR